jgi:hypothetical protein
MSVHLTLAAAGPVRGTSYSAIALLLAGARAIRNGMFPRWLGWIAVDAAPTEADAFLVGERERLGQQPHGVGARVAQGGGLQAPDGAHAQAGTAGELFLGEQGALAPGTYQPREGGPIHAKWPLGGL